MMMLHAKYQGNTSKESKVGRINLEQYITKKDGAVTWYRIPYPAEAAPIAWLILSHREHKNCERLFVSLEGAAYSMLENPMLRFVRTTFWGGNARFVFHRLHEANWSATGPPKYEMLYRFKTNPID